MSTVCDILRDGVRATMSASACVGSSPSSECYIIDLATKRDMYIQTKYNPAGLISGTAQDARNKELSILQNDIDTDIKMIQSKYGANAPTDNITWNTLTECLWNSNGSSGGPNRNKYFKRNDLTALGYQPQPILDVTVFENKLPASFTDKIPIWMDHIFNPGFAVIIIFAFLLLVFTIIMYTAYEWTKNTPVREASAKTAWRKKMEKNDPYKGTPFESYPSDPNSKWKALVPIYEAQGYCMEDERIKLGMPVTDHCKK